MKWTRKKFKEYFGEDPEDIFGSDWENYVEEYADEQNDDIYNMKFGRA